MCFFVVLCTDFTSDLENGVYMELKSINCIRPAWCLILILYPVGDMWTLIAPIGAFTDFTRNSFQISHFNRNIIIKGLVYIINCGVLLDPLQANTTLQREPHKINDSHTSMHLEWVGRADHDFHLSAHITRDDIMSCHGFILPQSIRTIFHSYVDKNWYEKI